MERTTSVDGRANVPFTIAGIATVASSLSLPAADRGPHTDPIPWIHIHGSEDEVIDPENTAVTGSFRVSNLDDAHAAIKARNNLTGTVRPQIVNEKADETSVETYEWPATAMGAKFTFVHIIGGGHTWPGHTPPEEIVLALALAKKSLGRTTREFQGEERIAAFFGWKRSAGDRT